MSSTTWADWTVIAVIAIALVLAFRYHPWLALLLGRGSRHRSS
jgi:hypothetical protein